MTTNPVAMNIVSGEGYAVRLDHENDCVHLAGSLRLDGLSEYAPISSLLDQALHDRSELTLDLRELEFLNSSGIATLSKFVISARNHQDCALRIRGSNEIAWQGKSLNNLKRLMPALELTFD
ncbi:hypothetical protein J2T57_001947 [Natronocella acetinitrilica]|uniref:STAS domain-containing protein n=1 Tax=Natronocella acetinitrilica TaxID=414046 RepID=A0AAE3KBH8_9GAMM|nr:hypothetical protein [Natronocella acetinitrilica]MCP1674809.1 hypothetical protein [Natronocella acetinitrilica]